MAVNDVPNRMLTIPTICPPRMPLTPAERQAEAVALFGVESAPFVLHSIPGVFDREINNAVNYPHQSLTTAYESGCAEPWTSQLVTSILIASNRRNVLETGAFMGQTSAWMAMALERLGGGTLTTIDIDAERVGQAKHRIDGLGLTRVTVRAVHDDVLHYLQTIPDKSVGFAWIDDNHEKHHVETELRLLWPKMELGGIICGHDVWGSCNLQTVFKKYGGLALNYPRLGAAGGCGIIQVPDAEMLNA